MNVGSNVGASGGATVSPANCHAIFANMFNQQTNHIIFVLVITKQTRYNCRISTTCSRLQEKHKPLKDWKAWLPARSRPGAVCFTYQARKKLDFRNRSLWNYDPDTMCLGFFLSRQGPKRNHLFQGSPTTGAWWVFKKQKTSKKHLWEGQALVLFCKVPHCWSGLIKQKD